MKDDKMKHYLIPFIAYLLMALVADFFLKNDYLSYGLAMLVTGALILFFWKNYQLKFKPEFWALLTGIAIFLSWILLEGKYPLLLTAEKIIPSGTLQTITKVIGFVIITPIIEELFTRGFLIRCVVSDNWKKVPLGKFTWLSFIITVLFFGLSHAEWLQGIVAGVLLNLLYYRTKSVSNCIIAHALCNLLFLF
jgi:hypothetical protein